MIYFAPYWSYFAYIFLCPSTYRIVSFYSCRISLFVPRIHLSYTLDPSGMVCIGTSTQGKDFLLAGPSLDHVDTSVCETQWNLCILFVNSISTMHILDDPVSKPSVVIKIYQVAVYFSFRINLQSFVVVPVSKRHVFIINVLIKM